MEAAWKIICIASVLVVSVCQASLYGRSLLADGPPFYRPPLGYGSFNYRSAFEDYNTPGPQRNYTVHRAGASTGHGLTAWAIVGIVLAVLAVGAFVYFAALCYPVLCRRRRAHSQLHDKEQHV